MIFNANKNELLEMIEQKIAAIDEQCAIISREISMYSQERLDDLTLLAQTLEKDSKQLQKIKIGNQALLDKLKNDLVFLEEQQKIIEQECKTKQRQMNSLDRVIIFMEEKYKDEAPHLKSYEKQKGRSKQMNAKVRYAKEKLQKLNVKLGKECQEVEYQYRLNKLLRDKLKEIRNKKAESSGVKQSSGTAISSTDICGSTPIYPPQYSKKTQLSDYNQSIISSFRDS